MHCPLRNSSSADHIWPRGRSKPRNPSDMPFYRAFWSCILVYLVWFSRWELLWSAIEGIRYSLFNFFNRQLFIYWEWYQSVQEYYLPSYKCLRANSTKRGIFPLFFEQLNISFLHLGKLWQAEGHRNISGAGAAGVGTEHLGNYPAPVLDMCMSLTIG